MPQPSTSKRAADPELAPERTWARAAGLGLQFAATVGVFVALGLWADRRLGTKPWLLLVGAALGFAGALLALVRAVPSSGVRRGQGSQSPSSTTPPRSPKEP